MTEPSVKHATTAMDPQASEPSKPSEVAVIVPADITAKEFVDLLLQYEIIAKDEVSSLTALLQQQHPEIKKGNYVFTTNLSNEEILQKLKEQP